MCCIYGWTRDYVLWSLDLGLLLIYYKYGYEFDMERRGWEFKNKKDENTPTFDEIAQDLYSPEELKEREKFLKKQFGDNIKDL